MSPVQGKPTPVQVKGPYSNLDMVTCRLSSSLPIMPVSTVYIERKKFNPVQHINTVALTYTMPVKNSELQIRV